MTSSNGNIGAKRVKVAASSLKFKRLFILAIVRTRREATYRLKNEEYVGSRWRRKETFATKGDPDFPHFSVLTNAE